MYEAEVRMSFKLKLTRSGDSFFFLFGKTRVTFVIYINENWRVNVRDLIKCWMLADD